MPKIELGINLVQKKYSVQSHVRVMDFIRILKDTYNLINRTSGVVLFADKNGNQILLRGDELITEVYNKMAEEDGWLYLHFDTQKRFG